jgi:hypothetical protein
MRQIIKNLRAKPNHVKQMVSLFTALAITAVIGAIWVVGMAFSGGGSDSTDTSKLSNADGTPSPLAVIKDQFSNFAKTAGEQMAGVGSAFNSMVQQSNSASSTNVNQ